ncbi:lipase family protein [Paraburkholderia sp. BR10882]|uniref:lipase family protein n=1 Tax=unclassified Paraburkholderia TaxID=2615204 RepID=UPI0034D01649
MSLHAALKRHSVEVASQYCEQLGKQDNVRRPQPAVQPAENPAVDAAATIQCQSLNGHLRAEVWSNEDKGQVIVAFGGTAASSMDDWKANLRWLLAPLHPTDEYSVLTDTFVPTFITEFNRRVAEPQWAWLKRAHVIATGHSLGGGLAQRFAYSLSAKSGVPAVKVVYAFDPSPVSGKRSAPDFAEQADGLTIYRIYNRGEILASLRSLLHFGDPGNERNQGQEWIDIRYLDNWSWRTLLPSGSVHAHGMFDLARFMAANLPQAALRACADESRR